MKFVLVAAIGLLSALNGCGGSSGDEAAVRQDVMGEKSNKPIAQGKKIFRFETLGDEAKWTDTLRMHEVIAAAVDPTTALLVGLGSFSDSRLPLSVTNGTVDLVSSKLPDLQAYQLSLPAPPAPAGSFDTAAAARGKQVFEGKGQCASCHSGALFTDANTMLHPPGDSVVEPETPSYASRSATKLYRTSPLKGVWQHPPYFHDGSAATLEDVGRIYNSKRALRLTPQEITYLAQYLKSL